MRTWICRESKDAQVGNVEPGAGHRPPDPTALVLGAVLSSLTGVAVRNVKPCGSVTCHVSSTQQTLDMLIIVNIFDHLTCQRQRLRLWGCEQEEKHSALKLLPVW